VAVVKDTIESLLENLEEDETPIDPIKLRSSPSLTSIDNLIYTLEKKPSEESIPARKKFMGVGDNQLQIDAGQKKFGLVECKECGFQYNASSCGQVLIRSK